MNKLDEDLDDSALFCKSLVQKRKAVGNDYPKNSKQLKLCFSQPSCKRNQTNDNAHIKASKNSNNSEEKTKSNMGNSSTSKLDESKSSYFSARKSLNTCPVCLKSFKSDSAYSAHMKQCAKSHKMTTQQLLGALELQKKQMRERRALGLCSQKVSSPPKPTAKKKKENNIEPYDLALGLALSRSLSSAEAKGVAQTEVQKPTASQTLEEFGFTASNAPVGPTRKKNDIDKKSILRERTVEERQRIIVEKVAVILLDENQEGDSESKSMSSKSEFQNDQVPQLWNLGENNKMRSWYVDGIKALVMLDGENAEESAQPSVSYNIENEISKLGLPRKNIHEDWTKMINNSKLSDFTGKTKDCHDVYMHSVVLFAKCPQILEKDCESIFRKFNLSTVLIFLEFVYCGTLNSLTEVTEVNKLLDLGVEFNYDELVTVLNRLRTILNLGDCDRIPNSEPEVVGNEVKQREASEPECKKETILEDRDLFAEDEVVDLTQNNHVEQNSSGNESNVEKSYWSFIQHEKKREQPEEPTKLVNPEANEFDDETSNSKNKPTPDKINQLQRNPSDDSATRDFDDDFKKADLNRNSDSIILSSGSDSKTQENLAARPPHSRTPSPVNVDYEVPHFDPYDNFHFFSEDQFSPVGTHSQSLITGDISMESLKSTEAGLENGGRLDDFDREPKKTVGYCSTPVTVRQASKVKPTDSLERSRKRKMRDLTASRIIRKSLGLQQKMRLSNSGSSKRTPSAKKAESRKERALAEALTNSILHELSKSSVFQSSPAARSKMFVEMTPISNRDEFVDNVTPSPNYSTMGESVLKEQLTKYGLKKNLAKSKAKKILRYIYEELHPLYNTETGKIVKMLPQKTPKPVKKSKSNATKSKRTKNDVPVKKKPVKKQKNQSDSSKESASDNGSNLSIDRLTNYDSDESEFGNLSETLTQSTPSNPVDLASAFFDFLEFNPEYHRQILLYEPIWLEELQRKLKETFKKHFKLSDLMDFLDQKCITFRSEAHARNLQRRNEKRKENCKKKKNNSC